MLRIDPILGTHGQPLAIARSGRVAVGAEVIATRFAALLRAYRLLEILLERVDVGGLWRNDAPPEDTDALPVHGRVHSSEICQGICIGVRRPFMRANVKTFLSASMAILLLVSCGRRHGG